MAIHSQYITGRKFVELTHTIVYKDLNILSAYSLCSSLPFEELTVSLTSVGTTSLLIEELVASPGDAAIVFHTILNPASVASLASVYSLATAVT